MKPHCKRTQGEILAQKSYASAPGGRAIGGASSIQAAQQLEVQLLTRYKRELTIRTRDTGEVIRMKQPKDAVTPISRALKRRDPKAQAAKTVQSGEPVLTLREMQKA